MKIRYFAASTALSLLLVGGAASQSSAQPARLGCDKFTDHIMWFYNGGAPGDEYDATGEVALTDSGSWHSASVVHLDQVGSASNADQINVVFGNAGDVFWAGSWFPSRVSGDPCALVGGTAVVNRFHMTNRARIKYTVGHEVGHALGNDHNNQSDSIMNAILPDVPTVFQPSANDRWVTDTIYCPSCPTVALLGSNGLWVQAQNGGGGQLNASGNAVGNWERFKVHTSGSSFTLQSHNGQFVSQMAGAIQANANLPGSSTWFTIGQIGGNAIGLLAPTGYWWTRWYGPLADVASWIGSHETFYYYWQ